MLEGTVNCATGGSQADSPSSSSSSASSAPHVSASASGGSADTQPPQLQRAGSENNQNNKQLSTDSSISNTTNVSQIWGYMEGTGNKGRYTISNSPNDPDSPDSRGEDRKREATSGSGHKSEEKQLSIPGASHASHAGHVAGERRAGLPMVSCREGSLGVELNLQFGQLTLKSSHLKALDGMHAYIYIYICIITTRMITPITLINRIILMGRGRMYIGCDLYV